MPAARAAVYKLLTTDVILNSLGVQPANTFQTNSVDDPGTKPFVVMRWETFTATFGNVGDQVLSVWVHDERGDYSRIDQILERIREVLTEATHVIGEDGITLTSCRYQGTSDDFWDDGYRTITKYSTFTAHSRAS